MSQARFGDEFDFRLKTQATRPVAQDNDDNMDNDDHASTGDRVANELLGAKFRYSSGTVFEDMYSRNDWHGAGAFGIEKALWQPPE